MRHTVGGLWLCVALLALAACSSPVPPPPEGAANISNLCNWNAEIAGPGGLPTSQPLRPTQTVLDGRGGYHVSCSVKSSGGGYAFSAEIQSEDMSLTLYSGTASGNSGQVDVLLATTQSLNTYSDTTLSTSPRCTVSPTTNTNPGVFIAEPGSIWAQYNCTEVATQSDLSNTCSPRGIFVFTGCDR